MSIDNDKKAKAAGGLAAGATATTIGWLAAGSSASAMTGTLATIGLGSMATGIGVIAVAPLLVGYFAYKKVKK